MNIGDVAQRAGVPAKTIRYYEEIGLVTPQRAANGYRHFRPVALHKLAFIGRARALGFTIEDCRTLLALYSDDSRQSAQVKAVAQDHLRQIDEKIAKLVSMKETLSALVQQCAGDHRPDCPILADLADPAPRPFILP